MADVKGNRVGSGPGSGGVSQVMYRDEGDGTYSASESSNLRMWDSTDLAWVKVKADHATGGVLTAGGGGGGGAVTIADGADVAEGTTTDTAWVSGAGTVISLLKKIATAGGSAVSVADGADVVEGALADAAIITDTTGTVNGKLRGLVKWAFERMPASLGQKTMANSLPVVVASDQSAVPVSGTVTANAGTNLNTSALALDATLTGGTQKTKIVDTAGTNVAVVSAANALKVDGSAVTQPVSVAAVVHVDDNAGLLSVDDGAGTLTVDAPVGTPVFARLSDGAAALVGQKAMAASIPVVVASDQTAVPENLTQVGGVAVAAKAASAFGVAALPVWPNAVQRDTYYGSATRIASGALVANTPVKIISIEHAATATKTVRIRRIIVSGYVSTAGAATAGSLDWFLGYGTAASSAGTVFTATKANAVSPAAEAVIKTLPTIVAATVLYGPLVTNAWNATGATVGSLVPFTVFYDWQENGETVPLTLRAGVLEALALNVQSQSATLVVTCSIKLMFTEE